jgi:hypothetical protein
MYKSVKLRSEEKKYIVASESRTLPYAWIGGRWPIIIMRWPIIIMRSSVGAMKLLGG